MLSWIANITLVGKPGTPGTPVDDGIGRFFKTLYAMSNASITPPEIPKALVVLFIKFKVLFNCLTNLFFLFIIEINSSWVGHVDIFFTASKILSWFWAAKSEALVTPNSAINVNTVGSNVVLIVLIWLDKRSCLK